MENTMFGSSTVAGAAIALIYAAAGQASIVEPGHTAVWYDPQRSGEGYVLEILDDSRATVAWFTYDEAGNQRWLISVGAIKADETGAYIDFPELVAFSGGRFGPDFDPANVERETVGSATLRFENCESGVFSYTAYNQSLSIDVVRLSQTMGAGCAPVHGVPGQVIAEYAGQSGSWYDVSHSGEGFQIQWTVNGAALFTWYTYDSVGNPYWMIGVGSHQDGRIVFPSIRSTRGAKFGAQFESDDVEFIDWGSISFELNCSSGLVVYSSTLPEFGAGTQDVSRLTYAVDVSCPWTPPRLSDLYDLEVSEISLSWPQNPLAGVRARSIADDGTVFGAISDIEGSRLGRLRPGEADWEALTTAQLRSLPIATSPSGAVVAVNAQPPSVPDGATAPLLWTAVAGLQMLTGLIYQQSSFDGVSQDLSRLVGVGRPAGDAKLYPWIWDAEQGQIKLPLSDDVFAARPTAAANDGSIVVGWSLKATENGMDARRAIRWRTGELPKILSDPMGSTLGPAFLCNFDCSLVYGAGQSIIELNHPNASEPWFLRSDGSFAYLGSLPNALIRTGSNPPAAPLAVTDDGSMAVGYFGTLKDGVSGEAGFIWTQNTGLVSIKALLEDLEFTGWDYVRGASMTSNGETILLTGESKEEGEPLQFHAALLRLIPKE